MRFFFTSVITILLSLQSFGQYVDPITKVTDKKARKHYKYKLNVWKYTYEVYMKDGSTIKANSDILQEGKGTSSFIYYSKNDSLRKILPEETIKVIRPNPYDMRESLIGYPSINTWKFVLLKGKINATYLFNKGWQISEIQINEGEISPFSPEYLRSIIKTENKALEAWEQKDYFSAIKIYNRKAKN
jgi:hypothetical protein